MADIRDLKTAEDYIRLRQERKELQARINALEKENAELREKAGALDMLEKMADSRKLSLYHAVEGWQLEPFLDFPALYDRAEDAIRAAYTAWKEGES